MIVQTFIAPDAPAGQSIRCAACGKQLARAIEPGGYITTVCRGCKAIIGIRTIREAGDGPPAGDMEPARVTRVR